MDLCCSVTMQLFLDVTIHYINKGCKLVNLDLATKEVHDVHSETHIAARLQAVIDDYEMSLCQIVAIVTDNGTNIINAYEKLKSIVGSMCVAYTVHTANVLKASF